MIFCSMTGKRERVFLKTSLFSCPVTLFMPRKNGTFLPNTSKSLNLTSPLTRPIGSQPKNMLKIPRNISKEASGFIFSTFHKDMQSLLIDAEKNIPMEEEKFSKVEDERVSKRCNFRKVCRDRASRVLPFFCFSL